MIWPPLPLYDPPLKPPLGCIFPYGYTTFLPNILSSALLCLWFWSSLTALSCHSSIVLGGFSASTNFLLSTLLNPSWILWWGTTPHSHFLLPLSWTPRHIHHRFFLLVQPSSTALFSFLPLLFPQICSSFCQTIPLPSLFLTPPLIVHPVNCPSMPLPLSLVHKTAPRPSLLLPTSPSFSYSDINKLHW